MRRTLSICRNPTRTQLTTIGFTSTAVGTPRIVHRHLSTYPPSDRGEKQEHILADGAAAGKENQTKATRKAKRQGTPFGARPTASFSGSPFVPSSALGEIRRRRKQELLEDRARRPQIQAGAQAQALARVGADALKHLGVTSLLWLRDACPCVKCVDPDSGQKNFSTVDLPSKPTVKSAEIEANGNLKVVWAKDATSGVEEHESVYSAEFQASLNLKAAPPMPPSLPRILWNRVTLEEQMSKCRISHSDWMSDTTPFWDAMVTLRRTGILFVHGVPDSETAVERIGERIGPLLDTIYGRTWDVVSKPRAENVAYTDRELPLHQDLLYFQSVPPRIQLLHCLANEAEGGMSTFSDGVRAAEELSLTQPKMHSILTRKGVRFGYSRQGHAYSATRRVIVPEAQGSWTVEPPKVRPVAMVFWSPPFQIPYIGQNDMVEWHAAARAFRDSASAPENMYVQAPHPGECVIFDNLRILHGRTAFDAATGKRWLKGAYVGQEAYNRRMAEIPEGALGSFKAFKRADVREQELKQILADQKFTTIRKVAR